MRIREVEVGDRSRTLSDRDAGIALAVLTFINLFNYLDRYVVSSLVESLKKSELALSDTQLGFLMTGFVLVYGPQNAGSIALPRRPSAANARPSSFH
jgi:hypothetical protein